MKSLKIVLLFVTAMTVTFDASAMKRAADSDSSDGKAAKALDEKAGNKTTEKLAQVKKELEHNISASIRLGDPIKIKITPTLRKPLLKHMTVSCDIDLISLGGSSTKATEALISNKAEKLADIIIASLIRLLTSFDSNLDALLGFEYRIESTQDTYTMTIKF